MKASEKVVNKLYTLLVSEMMEKEKAFIIDMLISRYCDMLGGFDAIGSPEELKRS